MDYPKSLPGIGLVGGKFADGDPVTGTAGSWIAAAWANAVMDELLNVITSAGLVPAEAQLDQLEQAITILARRSGVATFAEIDALTQDEGPIICSDHGGAMYVWDSGASKYAPLVGDETYAGSLRRATTAQAQALTDDTRAVTPKKLGDALIAHVLGMGQTWQDVTASRVSSTTYTNTTGRPIVVSVRCNNTTTSFNASLTVDGKVVKEQTFGYGSGSITSRDDISVIVPHGSTYSFTQTGGTWSVWMELR